MRLSASAPPCGPLPRAQKQPPAPHAARAQVSGSVRYNGTAASQFVVARTVAFVDQASRCPVCAAHVAIPVRVPARCVRLVVMHAPGMLPCTPVFPDASHPCLLLPACQLDWHIPGLSVLETCQFAGE